jgi:hypothetical protein
LVICTLPKDWAPASFARPKGFCTVDMMEDGGVVVKEGAPPPGEVIIMRPPPLGEPGARPGLCLAWLMSEMRLAAAAAVKGR